MGKFSLGQSTLEAAKWSDIFYFSSSNAGGHYSHDL